jgi:hypothetical protein
LMLETNKSDGQEVGQRPVGQPCPEPTKTREGTHDLSVMVAILPVKP